MKKHCRKGKKPHICDTCFKEFKGKIYLLRHSSTHVQDKIEQECECYICHSKHSRKDNLQRHLKSCHNISQKKNVVQNMVGFAMFEREHLDRSVPKRVKQNVSNVVECDQCEYKSKRNSKLDRHYQGVHILGLTRGRKRKSDGDEMSQSTKNRRLSEEITTPKLSKDDFNEYLKDKNESDNSILKTMSFSGKS